LKGSSAILAGALPERLAAQYNQPDSPAIYKLRKQKVELPFGHIKQNLRAGHFLLHGLKGCEAEK
jgi:hypothetical protein